METAPTFHPNVSILLLSLVMKLIGLEEIKKEIVLAIPKSEIIAFTESTSTSSFLKKLSPDLLGYDSALRLTQSKSIYAFAKPKRTPTGLQKHHFQRVLLLYGVFAILSALTLIIDETAEDKCSWLATLLLEKDWSLDNTGVGFEKIQRVHRALDKKFLGMFNKKAMPPIHQAATKAKRLANNNKEVFSWFEWIGKRQVKQLIAIESLRSAWVPPNSRVSSRSSTVITVLSFN